MRERQKPGNEAFNAFNELFTRFELTDEAFLKVQERIDKIRQQAGFKKFSLQRIGVDSKMFFCGDVGQVDLKRQRDSGLSFLSSIKHVKGIHTVELLENYRHPILKDLLEVYKNFPSS